MLTAERRFPPATVMPEALSWKIAREMQSQRPQYFNIDLLDTPGGRFSSIEPHHRSRLAIVEKEANPDDLLIERLADCEGLILLFDPIREWERGDSYDYFAAPLLRIAEYRLGRMERNDSKLPHYLAVCITKFDEPRVYKAAVEGGYVSIDENDPAMVPRVQSADAQGFLRYLLRQSDTGRGDLMLQAVTRYFRPERVAYFVTSAVGFYRDQATGRFDPNDYQNVLEAPDGQRIRARSTPLMSLNQSFG